MATLILSAAGWAAGSAVGGSVLGLAAPVIGRAVGATVGRLIDERLMGAGSQTVETGRVERFRLTGASEGAPISRVWGRMRVAGQVIWASRFSESYEDTRHGGKGGGASQTVREYSYSVSLAVALTAGQITRIGRIWADGIEIAPGSLTLSVYDGREDQLPDPTIEAIEGAGQVPAFRGLAYVVISDLDLGRFGNRVPQFSFEVMRPELGAEPPAPVEAVEAVCLVPGTGEYALSTRQMNVEQEDGTRVANVATAREVPDLVASLDDLQGDLPNVRSVGLVVSWFGSDLRCAECRVRPRAENDAGDAEEMAWRVAGRDRAAAGRVVLDAAGAPLYGGTPADEAVIEAIRELKTRGLEAMFYPFLLMEPVEGNTLPNPWTGEDGQPALPWRGRITTTLAPGIDGSPDGTAAAEAEVDAFFGGATAADFALVDGRVVYSGPDDDGYARFILHYAWLCRAAGGIDAFCIGSEMRSLTWIRGAGGTYPAVARFIALLRDVRAVLGPDVDLSYAADWSEYSAHRADGDLRFHLDPLWADPDCDFVGIDNYLPLTDWRDDPDQADADFGAPHDLDYLRSGVLGGEHHDWYYPSPEAEAAQRREPITDGAHDEPWVWRVKDLRSWWREAHHERIGGTRQPSPTAWVPEGKPIRFTEYGCAAVDRATNQPNVFLDPKSSESRLPRASDGRRDELIQHQYVRAVTSFWGDPAENPLSQVYGERMLDLGRSHLWAWDARPWPAFPGRVDLWTDGPNYARGHWLNGRASGRTLASVIADICREAGLTEIDVSACHGFVRGYRVAEGGTARAALQPLLLAYGVDAVEREGRIVFAPRSALVADAVPREVLVADREGDLDVTRAPVAELPEAVRLTHVEGEGVYETRVVEARLPGREIASVAESEGEIALTVAEARGAADRYLAEARAGREVARFALPPSRRHLGAGDVVSLDGAEGRWRIDRVERGLGHAVTATRVDPAAYRPPASEEVIVPLPPAAPAVPVTPVFLDLPLLTGEEAAHAPHLAVEARPWPGAVAVVSAPQDAGYGEARLWRRPASMGRTLSALPAAAAGRLDRGAPLIVRLGRGRAASATEAALLSGANVFAIGTGGPEGWELFQAMDVVPAGPGLWHLSRRLRGQAGTEADMPEVWPVGARIVLIDGAVEQVELPEAARGVARHWRIGPAQRPLDDATYRHEVHAFRGIGLRPYAPAHLRLTDSGGDLELGWVRRSRRGGDAWDGAVPLAEDEERYEVRVLSGGTVLRRAETTSPGWAWTAAQRAVDAGATQIEVAQVSAAFGPGAAARIDVA